MSAEKIGRFAGNLHSMTDQSLRPHMEGLPKREPGEIQSELPNIPFSKHIDPSQSQSGSERVSFGNTLEGMLKEVSSLQQQAKIGTERMLTGEVEDVHQVMVAVEKASTSFLLMMEIRNKLVEAYREVMRMQV
ncbi:MAG: flagellar hook-basal body complex protein FliE [bacterium]|nr:flagellar hook-basal body complex protein FliE [bacterium]